MAVTLGLLLPFPELQGTSEAQLRASGDLSASPDDSLIAVLLSRRLWPSMAQTPSYPRLAQALLKRTAFLPGTLLCFFYQTSLRPSAIVYTSSSI